jgi:hypothetical protein
MDEEMIIIFGPLYKVVTLTMYLYTLPTVAYVDLKSTYIIEGVGMISVFRSGFLQKKKLKTLSLNLRFKSESLL